MARPIRHRKLPAPPPMGGFRPYGMAGPGGSPVVLLLDEYESLNLCYYQGIGQDEAAQRMGVSRPTFTRIINRAIGKIASALVEGSPIRIEGGQVVFERPWFKCKRCHRLFDGKESHTPCPGCPAFGEAELEEIGPGVKDKSSGRTGCENTKSEMIQES